MRIAVLALLLASCGSGNDALKTRILDAARATDVKAFEGAFAELETRVREKNDTALKNDVVAALTVFLDSDFKRLCDDIESWADAKPAEALQHLAGLAAVVNRTLPKNDPRVAELQPLSVRVHGAASLADAAAGRWNGAYQNHRKAMSADKGGSRQHEAHDALSAAIAAWANARGADLNKASRSNDGVAVARIADELEGALENFYRHDFQITMGSSPCKATLSPQAERALSDALASFDAGTIVLVVTGSAEGLREVQARCRIGDAYRLRAMTSNPDGLNSDRRARMAAFIEITVEMEEVKYGNVISSVSLPKHLRMTWTETHAPSVPAIPWPRDPWESEVETPETVRVLEKGFTSSATDETRRLAGSLDQTLRTRLRDHIRAWPEWTVPNPD